MNTYHVLDSLPGTPEDAAVLLDADITKDRFKRTQSDLWNVAIKTRALTRMPGFGDGFRAFVAANYAGDLEPVLFAKVLARGSSLATGIAWITDKTLGKGQLVHAIDGASFMTFEKATVCILALNALIVEDIRRYQADLERDTQQLAALEPGANAEPLQAQIKATKGKIQQLEGALIGKHSIIISCFYFYNIAPVVRAALTAGGHTSVESLANAIATEADQPASVIVNLFGDHKNTDPSRDRIDRAVGRVASYPTMRAIFKTLLAIEACRNVVGTANREDYIQRLHVGIGNKKAIPEERMIRPKRITRPPYDWGPAAKGEEPYPPGFHDDEPHAG